MRYIPIRMQWAGRKSQSLRPFGHRRVVDRLHIDPKLIHQIIRDHLTFNGIFDHHRNDVTWIVQMRNARLIKRFSKPRHLTLLRCPLQLALFEMLDRTPSASAIPPPRGPYMPTACTSSRYVIAPCLSATSQISAIGAISPSIE